MARQPKAGTSAQAASADTGSPVTTNTATSPSQRPRCAGGTNSVMVE